MRGEFGLAGTAWCTRFMEPWRWFSSSRVGKRDEIYRRRETLRERLRPSK